MPRTLDGLHEHPLMAGTRARDPFRDDPSLFGNESLKLLFVFIVDVDVLVIAEPTRTLLANLGPPLRAAALITSLIAPLLHATAAALRPL